MHKNGMVVVVWYVLYVAVNGNVQRSRTGTVSVVTALEKIYRFFHIFHLIFSSTLPDRSQPSPETE